MKTEQHSDLCGKYTSELESLKELNEIKKEFLIQENVTYLYGFLFQVIGIIVKTQKPQSNFV